MIKVQQDKIIIEPTVDTYHRLIDALGITEVELAKAIDKHDESYTGSPHFIEIPGIYYRGIAFKFEDWKDAES